MKKNLFLIILAFSILSCEKEINITTPTIIVENPSISVFDSIKIKVEEYADIDGEEIKAEYFDWSVETFEGNIVKTDFPDSKTINWVPQISGKFIIKVKIGYDNNKSITATKDISVQFTAESLAKQLIGHWFGTGIRKLDLKEWELDLYFETKGHFYGTAYYNNFDPYCDNGVFNTGTISYYTNNELDSCGVPGELECERFDIQELKNGKGIGVVSTGWTTYIDGELFQEYCSPSYDLEDLEFSANGDTLYFEFNDYGPYDFYDWVKKFKLVRKD